MMGPHGTAEERNSGSHHTKAWVDLTQVPGHIDAQQRVIILSFHFKSILYAFL